jgi:VCBS repeat-containing protein
MTIKLGTSKDDTLNGTAGTDILLGGNGDDVLNGGGGSDLLVGGNGADSLYGGSGNDLLDGGNGNDILDGGSGDDLLDGGNGDDSLDGGEGSDILLAGKGNDILIYTVSQNTDSFDYYDGGKGFDTLLLNLTSAELTLAQADIDAFNAFLQTSGSYFYFESFNLLVRDIESLQINVIGGGNTAPVAANDAFDATEDAAIGGNVLANDTDADGDALVVASVNGDTANVGAVIALASGALLSVSADGSLSYDPNGAFEALGVGESHVDTFTYEVRDPSGEAASATAQVTVAGVNDGPSAVYDQVTANENDAAPAYNLLANDSDSDANDTLTVVSVNGGAGNVGTAITLASGALLTVGADGTVDFDPNGGYEALGANESVIESLTYEIADSQGALSSATLDIVVAGINDAPVARNDVVANTLNSPIKVAVIGNDGVGMDSSSYLAAAAQLNPALFGASAIAHSTGTDWDAVLKGGDDVYDYDVVVIGDDGFGADYTDSGIFAALADFVNAGGGVITTGWFATRLSEYASTPDADYITPIASGTPSAALGGQTIDVTDDAHPITAGFDNYIVDTLRHDLAVAADTGAQVLAQWVPPGGGEPLVAIAVDEVGTNGGRTVFLGSLYMANDAIFITGALRVEGSVGDQIFERAVAWAAGEQTPVAATDEDTALVIDDQFLFGNDSDVEGDPLEFFEVMALSARGAAVSINSDGNVLYDPTAAAELQALNEGDVVEDSFSYRVSDGQGGVSDWASVSLSVLGQADAII